jgi:hypothetical protein
MSLRVYSGLILGCAAVFTFGVSEASSVRASDLSARVGERVVLAGRVSQTPWQHMIRGDLKKQSAYIDLERGGQIVAYAEGSISCPGTVVLTGTVLLTEGSSKRPGSKEVGSEVQLDVESWQCLDAAAVQGLLDRLASPAVTRPEKADVEAALATAGKESIPALIAHLKDRRTCWKEKFLLNEGELMNRAPNAPPVAERWVEGDVAVGSRCEEILLRIVTPVHYESPYAGNFKPTSGGSRPFRVEDWGAWWLRNRDKPLTQIREDFKPVLDAYWKSRGTQQVVR